MMASSLEYTELLKAHVKKRVNLSAGGNSERKMKNVAIDLINESNLDHSVIAAGCYLCTQTITNLADETTRNPQSETIERIFKFFEMSVNLKGVAIKNKYLNQPKVEPDEDEA